MKNSEALVKPFLLAATCVVFLLAQNCHEMKSPAKQNLPEKHVVQARSGYLR